MPLEDLSPAATKKFDIEAWMPGREVWGEISSASNCTDYQSTRLGIKYKTKDGETDYVHTCNGTALASARILIALLETHQNVAKKRVEVPQIIKQRLPTSRSPTIGLQKTPAIKYSF